jgi:protein-L-histidine (3S)-3-hydroxylase / [histone H3]-trimethyl-L-lysine4/36 demethylase
LDYLLWPMDPERFFEHHWERRPLLVRRHAPDYYAQLEYSRESGVFEPLRSRPLLHRRHVDVTSYRGGARQTHFKEGRLAEEAEVRGAFTEQRCSVRMLHPQQYHRQVWRLLSALEQRWNMGSGANAYLTPADSQGFAPHYDDVDVFVLQLEGSKRWRLYTPPDDQLLPRFSSPNFAQEEIGAPFADLTLHAGDLLYLPRGAIHQAVCVDEDSLHLTVSTGLRSSWADFFRVALPAAVELAEAEEPALFRRSMPVGWLRYMGVMYADDAEDEPVESRNRHRFLAEASALLQKVGECMPVDGVADRMAAEFVRGRLPPFRMRAPTIAEVRHRREASTRVSMACDQALRLAVAGDRMLLYSHLHNPRMLHSAADPARGILLDQVAIDELAEAATGDKQAVLEQQQQQQKQEQAAVVTEERRATGEKEEEEEEEEDGRCDMLVCFCVCISGYVWLVSVVHADSHWWTHVPISLLCMCVCDRCRWRSGRIGCGIRPRC